jgi:transcriptional regulator GlxA family with amidase domain
MGVKGMGPRIKAVLEIAARELAKPLLVKELAARLHLSPSRLEHLIKKEEKSEKVKGRKGVR